MTFMSKAAKGLRSTVLTWANKFLQSSRLEPCIHDLSLILIDAMLLEPTSKKFRIEVLCLTCILIVTKLCGTRWAEFSAYFQTALNKLSINKSDIFNCEFWVLLNIPAYFAQVPDFTELLISFSSLSSKNRHLKVDLTRLWHQSTNNYINATQRLSLSDILSPLAPEPGFSKKKTQQIKAQVVKALRHVEDKARLLNRKRTGPNKNAVIVRSETRNETF